MICYCLTQPKRILIILAISHSPYSTIPHPLSLSLSPTPPSPTCPQRHTITKQKEAKMSIIKCVALAVCFAVAQACEDSGCSDDGTACRCPWTECSGGSDESSGGSCKLTGLGIVAGVIFWTCVIVGIVICSWCCCCKGAGCSCTKLCQGGVCCNNPNNQPAPQVEYRTFQPSYPASQEVPVTGVVSTEDVKNVQTAM